MRCNARPALSIWMANLKLCPSGIFQPSCATTIVRLSCSLSDVDPNAAFVDVQPPTVVDVVASLAAEGRPAVVVPLLLSGGYHVHVDIAGAVAAHPRAVSARPLGPDDLAATIWR